MKKLIALLLAMVMCLSLVACGGGETPTEPAGNDEPAGNEAAGNNEPAGGEDQIVITLMSNLPDRTSGEGLLEQTILDAYMAENPNVKIEVEAYPDADYKTKYSGYLAAPGTMPDLTMNWVTPARMNDVMAAGVYAEIDPAAIADYNFADGSLETCTWDGKIYGLARNTDTMLFYYNMDLFEELKLEVPKTWEELLALGPVIEQAGYVACATNGAEAWGQTHLWSAILAEMIGADYASTVLGAYEKNDFSAECWTESTQRLLDLADALYPEGWEVTDYGTSKNMFLNGGAAMFWMGSWEMGMTADFEIGAFALPAIDNGTDGFMFAFPGAGYMVTAGTENEEAAMDLLLWMMKPENWSAKAWELGVCISAQDFYNYETGNETNVQKAIMAAMNATPGWSGMSITNRNPETDGDIAVQVQGLEQGLLTIDEFFTAVHDLVAAAE